MSTSFTSGRVVRVVVAANSNLFGARARNFNSSGRRLLSKGTRKMSIMTISTTTTTTTTTPRLVCHRSYTTSRPTSSSHKHPSLPQPTQLVRSQSTNSPSSNANVFTSPFWSLDHCAHCYPDVTPSGVSSPNRSTGPQHPVDGHEHKHEQGEGLRQGVSSSASSFKDDLKRISEETIRLTKFNPASTGTSTSTSNKAGSGSGSTSTLPRGEQPSHHHHLLSHPHTHTHLHAQNTQPSHVNMSTSAPISAPPTTSTPTPSKPTSKPPAKPGQGILVPASKVHTSIKSELLHTLSLAEFNPDLITDGGQAAEGEVEGRRGRGVKLVGILATGMEDAANYAEVSRLGSFEIIVHVGGQGRGCSISRGMGEGRDADFGSWIFLFSLSLSLCLCRRLRLW